MIHYTILITPRKYLYQDRLRTVAPPDTYFVVHCACVFCACQCRLCLDGGCGDYEVCRKPFRKPFLLKTANRRFAKTDSGRKRSND